jgi:hypothetical protein
MENPVSRTAQIVLSALLTAGLCGCGKSECEKLRDTCNKCTDSFVRNLCLDWARDMDSGGPIADAITDNEVCAIGIDMYQECR